MSSRKVLLEIEMHRKLVDACVVASCLSCYHFRDEMCQLPDDPVRPPVEVIVYGCPAWDCVPFS